MPDLCYAIDAGRGCLAVEGEEARGFLQGLLTNDVMRVSRERAIYAALLSAQGRLLHDLFLVEPPASGDKPAGLLLEGEAARLEDLRKRLTLYKLRAKVAIRDERETYSVVLLWGRGALEALGLQPEPGRARRFGHGVAFVDPRLTALGVRALLPPGDAAGTVEQAGFAASPLSDYRRLRLSLGVPEGNADLPAERALPLENGFEELHGVDFKKGCYIGQEVTARMKYRALVKKRLLPVTIRGEAPAPGTPVMLGEREAGELRSAEDGQGLALLRLDLVDEATAETPLIAGPAALTAHKPDWLALQPPPERSDTEAP
jgi:folate-binding protein YgfZ